MAEVLSRRHFFHNVDNTLSK